MASWRAALRAMGQVCWVAAAVASASSHGAAPAGYEDRLVQWGLAATGREVDPSPDGKRVQEILVASEDVVAPTDPWPRLLNLPHVRTRERVVRRELLLGVGDRYSPALAAESERNLRRLFILAIAKVVPVREPDPGGVGLLVVTKDLWSIRLNSEFNLVQGTLLQYLRLRPTEQNFLGMNHQASLDFELRLDQWALGQVFTAQRVFDSKVTVGESARVFFNRATGSAEGSAGQLAVQRPLTSLEDRWAWLARVGWNQRPRRIYRGASIWELPYPDASAPTASVPFVYDSRELVGEASVTRSLGTALKLDLMGGLLGYSYRYQPPADSALDDAQRAWFRCNGLPRSEDAVLLEAAARAYEARYRVLHDVDAFGLSEDFQLGPSVVAMARWSEPALFSPQRFVEAGLSARYRIYAGDDLLTVSVAGSARWMPADAGCGVPGPWVNRRLAAELYELSPPVGPGRFAVRAMVDLRSNLLSRSPLALGGGNGLRGLDAEQLVGSNLVLVNLEYRTRPLELWTLHAGLVAFVDLGAAFPESPWVETAGLGLRLLFPQFDREVMRIDFGYVFGEPPGARPLYRNVSASFGQVTDYRPAYLDSPLN